MITFARASLLFAAAGALAAPPAAQAGTESCPVPPSRPDRPFFVAGAPERSDLRTDPSDGTAQEGAELRFQITVLDPGRNCRPVRDARVDVWGANARGVMSGVPAAGTAGMLFLRGWQETDAGGDASFTTIFPGWYPGRTPHVDYQVSKGGRRLVSQLVFDPRIVEQARAFAPYSERGAPDTTNASDDLVGANARKLLLPLTGAPPEDWTGRFTVGFGRPAQVDAELQGTSWTRVGGQRVAAVMIQAGERINVGLRLSRGGRVLSQRRALGLPRGRRVVNLIVRPGVSAGGAKLSVSIRDRAGHRYVTTRTVRVPRSG